MERRLCADPERAPLVREAFELIASDRFSTGDAVLKLITGMGLTTKKGRRLSKQSFARMLSNPVYTGWIVTKGDRIRGNHEPIISEDLFESVQARLNGKSRPHKKLNADFPLRGVIRCAKCGNLLTAGCPRGRKKTYPRYWCWEKDCKAVGISRDDLERQFTNLLRRMQPTAELLVQLPERAAKCWQERKARIATDARMLNNRLADQMTLNQKAIVAKLNGQVTAEDFDTVKKAITEEIHRIKTEITALDSEQNTMEDLVKKAESQAVDLVGAWDKGNVNQRHELATAFFPDGLFYSHELTFFEPANLVIQQMVWRALENLDNVGVPDGI